MSESRSQLLSIGVFCIILVVAILLTATGTLGWAQGLQLSLVLFGAWIIVLAAMRTTTSQKYERTAFSTAAMGGGLVILGAAWYIFHFGWLYSLALILLALGLIAIIAAVKRK